MNEQRISDGTQWVLWSELQRFMQTETAFIFRKFEGYIHSNIVSRSVPIDRLAGWQMKTWNSLVDKFCSIWLEDNIVLLEL